MIFISLHIKACFVNHFTITYQMSCKRRRCSTESFNWTDWINWSLGGVKYIQSGASSRAKHGGAYFSAVYGSIEDPMAAPGPYENLGPPFLGGSAQPVTFVLPLTHAHTASAPQRALQQDLFWNRSNVFVTKQIHETCFRTNPAGMPIDER